MAARITSDQPRVITHANPAYAERERRLRFMQHCATKATLQGRWPVIISSASFMLLLSYPTNYDNTEVTLVRYGSAWIRVLFWTRAFQHTSLHAL